MKSLSITALLLCLVGTAAANGGIPASLAAGDMPMPTFEDVHLATVRIVKNETGWKNLPDLKAIIQVLVSGGGGRKGRDYRGSGYGLDYIKYMTFAAEASLRTFPAEDPWALPVMVKRYKMSSEDAIQRQKELQGKIPGNVLWTSSMSLDCSEPYNWSMVYPESPWTLYTERCEALVQSVKETLKRPGENWCRTASGEPATPTIWGGLMDMHRVKPNWEELICDAPGASCPKDFDWRQDPNRTECAWNKYYRIRK